MPMPIFYTPFTQYNRLSNQLYNRFDNRAERTATVRSTVVNEQPLVRSTACQTALYNLFDNRLYKPAIYTIQPVVIIIIIKRKDLGGVMSK